MTTPQEIDRKMTEFLLRSRETLPKYVPKKPMEIQVEEQSFGMTSFVPLKEALEENKVSSPVLSPPVSRIFDIQPRVLSTTKGGPITISGENFNSPSLVVVRTLAGDTVLGENVKVVNSTTVTADLRGHAQGNVYITVKDDTNKVESASFYGVVFQYDPLFTSCSPAGGPISGGTAIKIYGTFFQRGGSPYVLRVRFDNEAIQTADIVSDIEAHITTPPHATAEWVNVTLWNKFDLSTTAASAFKYNPDDPPPPPPPPPTTLSKGGDVTFPRYGNFYNGVSGNVMMPPNNGWPVTVSSRYPGKLTLAVVPGSAGYTVFASGGAVVISSTPASVIINPGLITPTATESVGFGAPIPPFGGFIIGSFELMLLNEAGVQVPIENIPFSRSYNGLPVLFVTVT